MSRITQLKLHIYWAYSMHKALDLYNSAIHVFLLHKNISIFCLFLKMDNHNKSSLYTVQYILFQSKQ